MTLLSPENRDHTIELLSRLVGVGADFKLSGGAAKRRLPAEEVRDLLLTELPKDSRPVEEVVDELEHTVLPLCNNEASPQFLGFGHTGADVAGLAGALVALFAQQNLINQSFAAPSATFTEIAVLRWLRELLGLANPPVAEVNSVWDVGGIVTYGGTGSNAAAMLLAREHAAPHTLTTGVRDSERMHIVVPAGIGHYSVKASLAWIGVGAKILEVQTNGWRYDLEQLEATLAVHRGRVMSVIAYAGDSRTHTVENLRAVHDLVRAADARIWLHADACWGLMCALTDELAHRIDGIELYDSITVDPHKTLNLPYGVSALLVREPETLHTIASYSDLIMQEDWAFGQITPFIGSKAWTSASLWATLRAHGRAGLAELMHQRLAITRTFAALVDDHPKLLRLNEPEMTAVVFCYLPEQKTGAPIDVDRLNTINQAIHRRIQSDGHWHLHSFSIPDDTGRLAPAGTLLYPLRYMGNNTAISAHHLEDAIDYITALGRDLEQR